MTRSSPQTERLVDTVELLAGAPTEGRTLADIARHLAIDKATCYPMLVELTRVGWLVRHPRRKTFHLGPRLAAVGRAADDALDVVDLARCRLQQLADHLDTSAMIVLRSGDALLIGDIANPAGRRGCPYDLRAGDRLGFHPPHAAPMVAWADPATVDEWVGDTGVEGTADLLRTVRARGFAVEEHRSPHTITSASQPLPRDRGAQRAATIAERLDEWLVGKRLVGEIDSDGEYWPTGISAAVFDAEATPIAVITLVEQPRPTPGDDVIRIGQDVLAAALDVTHLIHGRAPLR